MTREALSFIFVGVSALLTHWLVVVLLVPLAPAITCDGKKSTK